MSPFIGNDSVLLRIQIVCLHIVIQFTLMEWSNVLYMYWFPSGTVHVVRKQLYMVANITPHDSSCTLLS